MVDLPNDFAHRSIRTSYSCLDRSGPWPIPVAEAGEA